MTDKTECRPAGECSECRGKEGRHFLNCSVWESRRPAGAVPADVEGLSDWRFKLDSEFAVDPDADTVSYKAYARLKAFARQAVGTIEQYRATLAAPDTLASERKAFEQAYAARSDGRVASFKFDRHPSGEYVDTAVDFAWWGWQAALRGRVVGAAAPYPAEATFELGSEKAAPLATGWQPHKGCPRWNVCNTQRECMEFPEGDCAGTRAPPPAQQALTGKER